MATGLSDAGVQFADTSVLPSAKYAYGFKNKIIGGDFSTNPWQRGTSFAAPVNAAYGADRFQLSHSTTGVVTILKTADAPTVSQADVFTQHCLHVDVTTADTSIAAGDYTAIQQKLEGYNTASFGFGQAGTRYVTLSFWHKHTKTGVHCVSVRNSAADRTYVAEYVQDVTDTWEKAVIVVPVDTSGTWLYDNGVGIILAFAIMSGTTYHATANTWTAGNLIATANQVNNLDSTSNNFKIALVQLEAGAYATAFETRSFQQELLLSLRYYYRMNPIATGSRYGSGYNQSTTVAQVYSAFPVTMRTSPTALEQSGTAADYSVAYLATATANSAVPTFSLATTDGAVTLFTVASGLTAGQSCMGRSNNGAAGYLGWSAEL
jgi:hypothetical protein